MKVLITGGAGYIGSMVSAHLVRCGMDVIVLDKLIYGGEALLSLFGSPSFRMITGDVRDGELLQNAMTGASAVVHLAGVVGEQACAVNPEAAWSTNYCGTQEVLRVASQLGIERILFASTCSNYGVSDSEALADEDFPLRPLSQYAEAKVRSEELILRSENSVCCSVLRFGTICGLSPRMRFDLLVNEMARSAVLGDPIQIFAPKAWRPFLHIRDAARAVAQCLVAPEKLVRSRVFNVVGDNYQKEQLVELALKYYPKTNISIAAKQADLRDYRASGDRIRRELEFQTRFSVEEAFVEIAAAVASGVFRDSRWLGHSAVPIEPARLQGN